MSGPEVYKLSSISAEGFTVTCPKGTNRFSGKAASNNPKLYVAVSDGQPIYVGITKQSMRGRLRGGWEAKGAHGYYGYSWRHKVNSADLMIWYQENGVDTSAIETIEAELVFLIRQAGQWPRFQTEIHFHPSDIAHRQIAEQIYADILARNRRPSPANQSRI